MQPRSVVRKLFIIGRHPAVIGLIHKQQCACTWHEYGRIEGVRACVRACSPAVGDGVHFAAAKDKWGDADCDARTVLLPLLCCTVSRIRCCRTNSSSSSDRSQRSQRSSSPARSTPPTLLYTCNLRCLPDPQYPTSSLPRRAVASETAHDTELCIYLSVYLILQTAEAGLGLKRP